MDDRASAAEAFPDLAKVAPLLNRKRGWLLPMFPLADLLGGSIYRLDEVVPNNTDVINALRPVLRYRTTLARGEPDESLRPQWDAARVLFPRWVGFRPNRRRWSRWSEAAYRHMEYETHRLRRLDEAFQRAERVAEIRARRELDHRYAGD